MTQSQFDALYSLAVQSSPHLASRLARARQILERQFQASPAERPIRLKVEGEIWRFTVRSQSNPLGHYMVIRWADKTTCCTCPDASKYICKHRLAVRMLCQLMGA
jgi:hypothetical protein